MIKVVLHCQVCEGNEDKMYGQGGVIHKELEALAGEEINFVGFGGFLAGQDLFKFLGECKEADLVILDAWTHPEHKDWIKDNFKFDPHEAMADVAKWVKDVNPGVIMFADLMEGKYEVAVHKHAKPLPYWADKCLEPVLRYLKAKKKNQKEVK